MMSLPLGYAVFDFYDYSMLQIKIRSDQTREDWKSREQDPNCTCENWGQQLEEIDASISDPFCIP